MELSVNDHGILAALAKWVAASDRIPETLAEAVNQEAEIVADAARRSIGDDANVVIHKASSGDLKATVVVTRSKRISISHPKHGKGHTHLARHERHSSRLNGHGAHKQRSTIGKHRKAHVYAHGAEASQQKGMRKSKGSSSTSEESVKTLEKIDINEILAHRLPEFAK